MPSVLITGGHGGIGLDCSKALTTVHGFDLILAGRSPEKMELAAASLRQASGKKVTLLPMDTSSLQSVRQAVKQCRQLLDDGSIDSLQAIICNAGGRLGDVAYTADGYEQTFATNHLGHSLLVELLVDRVAHDGRVLFTASGTHDPETTDGKLVGKAATPDAVALANTGKHGARPLSSGVRYSTSKLCNVMTAYEVARRLKKSGSAVTSNAFDPGAVGGEGFLREMPAAARWLAGTSFFTWVSKQLGVTPGDSAFAGASLARLAVDPEFKGVSGKYFQANGLRLIEKRSSTMSYDEQRAAKLWNDSQQLAHLGEQEASPLLR